MTRSLPRLAALVLLLAASASAQEPDPVSAPVAERPPACVALPLSGPHAALGKRILAAVDAAWAEANLPPLRRYDTRGTPADAAAAVAQVAADGCVGLIGGLGDRESVALADAAEAAGVPLLALGSEPDGRPRTRVAWVGTPRREPVAALARRLVADGVPAAVVLHVDSAWGRSVAEAFRAAYETAGGRILAVRVLPRGAGEQNDLASRLAGDLSRLPDRAPCGRESVFVAADLALAARLVPFLDFHGVTGRRPDPACPAPVPAGTPVFNDPARVARGGEALEGAVFADVAVPDGAPAVDAEAADAAVLLGVAVRAAGAQGRDGVARALSGEVAFTGRTGEVTLTGGRVTGRRIELFTIRRGAVVPVTAPVAPPAGPAAPGPATPAATER